MEFLDADTIAADYHSGVLTLTIPGPRSGQAPQTGYYQQRRRQAAELGLLAWPAGRTDRRQRVIVNSDGGSGEFSESQRAGLEERQADQDRTLAAVHDLEAMLGQAAPGREPAWSSQVLGALVALDQVTAEEADNADSPDSLLGDVARTQPWLRNRARGLRLQYRQLRGRGSGA